MQQIRFGTDGWRAVVAEDYTFPNVRRLAQATVDTLPQDAPDAPVAIGYDTRFRSSAFARAVAEVIVANDRRALLTTSFVPTPALSFAVRESGAIAGIMITASHNPAQWNGFKVKSPLGGTATAETTLAIERAIAEVGCVPAATSGGGDLSPAVDRIDAQTSYLEAIRRFVDINAIRSAGLSVVIDSMFGAAQGWIAAAVGDGATRFHELHGHPNPAFPGLAAPEPIASNLTEAMTLVESGGFDLGLATDGDGDRLGLIDEQGRFVTQLQTFALLVYYLLAIRGERGPIVRSVSMTRMVDRLGERFACPVHETAVGFRYLGPKFVETEALLAGEESGGSAFRGHIPERDGILAALFILDFVARTGKPISGLLTELRALVGTHEYGRVDIALGSAQREEIARRLVAARPKTVGGLTVTGRDEIDGVRFTLEDGWWLLFRFSGTEPLLRIYAEMPSLSLVDQALADGQELVGASG